MKSSDPLSQPVELEVIIRVLGNDILPNGRRMAGFKPLAAITVERKWCQHKHHFTEQNMHLLELSRH